MIIPPVRGSDPHGSGAWLASRGTREHEGIDLACYPESLVCSLQDGEVTKLGYPYASKLELRYVEVTNKDGQQLRYFYVQPLVNIGDTIKAGDIIGKSQCLGVYYPGITEHVHFEVKENGKKIDPRGFLWDGLATFSPLPPKSQ